MVKVKSQRGASYWTGEHLCLVSAKRRPIIEAKCIWSHTGWVSPGESIFTRRSVDLFQFSKEEINNFHKALQWGQLPGMMKRMNGLQPFNKLPAVSRGLLSAPCRPPFGTRSVVHSLSLNDNLCLNAAPGHLSTCVPVYPALGNWPGKVRVREIEQGQSF